MGKKKKKTISLNLNCYRNWSFHQSDDIKKRFKEIISPKIASLPRMTKLELNYSLFFGSKRSVDISNICCVVDKFFSDCLTELEKIPDDNMEVIASVQYRWGGVDSQNPRVEVTLDHIEVLQKEEPMQILLNQTEIEEAVIALVRSQIQIADNQTVEVDFRATRGEEGLTANISIGKASTPAQVASLAPLTAAQAEQVTRPRTRRTSQTAAETPAVEVTPVPVPAKTFDQAIEEAQAEKEEPVQQETAVTPIAAPGAIFPSKESSAAASTAAAPVQAAGSSGETEAAPKPRVSLFQNLKKPSNVEQVP